jgi:hypothetical protein
VPSPDQPCGWRSASDSRTICDLVEFVARLTEYGSVTTLRSTASVVGT